MRALLFLLALSSSAFATGGMDGGGGGAFVCPNGTAELLDAWEVRQLGGLTVNTSSVPAEQQLETIFQAFDRVAPELSYRVRQEWDYIRTHIFYVGSDVEILPPDDAKNKFKKVGCDLQGMMYFDGRRGRLMINKEIFDTLGSETEKAAAYFHESIYKYFRENSFKDSDSTRSRFFTGCAISSDPAGCIGLQTAVLPATIPIWKCESTGGTGMKFYIYKMDNNVGTAEGNWKLTLLEYTQTFPDGSTQHFQLNYELFQVASVSRYNYVYLNGSYSSTDYKNEEVAIWFPAPGNSTMTLDANLNLSFPGIACARFQ